MNGPNDMREEDKKHGQEIEDRIREAAYLMWEQAGRLSDLAHEYWVAAEKEVLAAWRTAAEKAVPGGKPEKAEEPKAEDSKPAASVPEKPARATAKPAANAPKAKKQKAETDRDKTIKPAGAQGKAAANAEKPESSKAPAAKSAVSEPPQPARAATKPAAKATITAAQKPSPAKPEASDTSRPAKVVAKPAGETPRKVEAVAAAPTEAPSAVEPTTEVGDKEERESLRNRTSRRTREKSEVRGRKRRLGKK